MSLWDELGGTVALIFGRIAAGDEKEVTVDADGHLQVDVLSTATGAVTIADGADVAEGATTAAAVITDANGTVSGKLRGLVKWAFERMPASLGQKAKAASLPVTLASDEDVLGVSVASGGIASGAIASGALAAGSVAAGAMVAGSQVDGHSATIGTVADAAVATDAAGTLSAKLRGIVKLLAEIITVKIDQTTPGTTNAVAAVSVPGALQGPGNPTVDSYTSAAVDLAASTANQALVAQPGANKQIWVYGLFMMADTAAGTVTLQDEDDTPLSGTMAISDEGGWVLPLSGNFAMPWIKVATNKALEADTGACTVDGIITYAVVSV